MGVPFQPGGVLVSQVGRDRRGVPKLPWWDATERSASVPYLEDDQATGLEQDFDCSISEMTSEMV